MLQWMDNFATYGLGGQAFMLNGPYAEKYGSIVADPDVNAPAGSLVYNTVGQFSSGQSTSLRKVLSANETTVGVALRLWMTSLPANASQSKSIVISDGVNTTLAYIYITSTGAIQVKNNAGTLLAASAGPVLVANAWQHIEFKALINAATGTVEVRVEGVAVCSATNVNTGAGPAAQVRIDNYADGTSAGIGGYIKDFAIWDGSGAFINDFVGTCSVYRLTVDGDSSFPWTPSSGVTGFNLLNEAGPDDTGYISAVTPPPAASIFTLQDLPANIVGIRGLMMFGRLRKSDAGDANIKMSMKSGASLAAGADRPVTTAFTYWYDFSHTDPATGAAWTKAGVNAALIQVDRTL